MKIVLIGNYLPDKQESMERFALMLDDGFKRNGIETVIWRPVAFLGFNIKKAHSGIGKWIGYIDKWLLFPLVIRWRVFKELNRNKEVFFHVCDHSNSPYLKHLPKDRSGITCHDVLAIRGAFGHSDAHNPASRLGIFLQKWILANLSEAKRLAAVSKLSLDQLKELSTDKTDLHPHWQVIHNALNAEFYPMDKVQRDEILLKAGISKDTQFLLHVGSYMPRKNRKMLLDMVDKLQDKYTGYICFAGHAVDAELLEHAKQLNLQNRIISVTGPDHETLVALYSACDAFVFPSYSEGFGWPVIEAQACGAPVVASKLDPMPEVSGGAAIHADPYNPQEFADAYIKLNDPSVKAALIQTGFDNIRHFSLNTMIKSYIKLYQ
ncbi:glycosyltransferase family 4 protein [Mucilaginibacter sp. Bleaf8]|uniref:glycosyltransferase family 4 protein n=1 Tax=Mucilaginibacter sp. Bleaf8 TaxID=2834430 RepID=UPI001BCE0C64|nr:glycosyltransferase family 1 protein [Mucilaginibacter sp. Bleaf8]MBS7566461.1 glycosyltransferase family 4 protein [Mucilaginibacter sp. Bleaf8]